MERSKSILGRDGLYCRIPYFDEFDDSGNQPYGDSMADELKLSAQLGPNIPVLQENSNISRSGNNEDYYRQPPFADISNWLYPIDADVRLSVRNGNFSAPMANAGSFTLENLQASAPLRDVLSRSVPGSTETNNEFSVAQDLKKRNTGLLNRFDFTTPQENRPDSINPDEHQDRNSAYTSDIANKGPSYYEEDLARAIRLANTERYTDGPFPPVLSRAAYPTSIPTLNDQNKDSNRDVTTIRSKPIRFPSDSAYKTPVSFSDALFDWKRKNSLTTDAIPALNSEERPTANQTHSKTQIPPDLATSLPSGRSRTQGILMQKFPKSWEWAMSQIGPDLSRGEVVDAMAKLYGIRGARGVSYTNEEAKIARQRGEVVIAGGNGGFYYQSNPRPEIYDKVVQRWNAGRLDNQALISEYTGLNRITNEDIQSNVMIGMPGGWGMGNNVPVFRPTTVPARKDFSFNGLNKLDEMNTTKSTGTSVGDLSGMTGDTIENLIKNIPRNANMRKLIPAPGGSQVGLEYKWIDENGKVNRFRVHDPDPNAGAGTNASEGWTGRWQSQGKYYDPITNDFRHSNVHKEASPFYDPTAANNTHVPIQAPSEWLINLMKPKQGGQ
ncbi:polymorphic toxin type 30 domain-containing protein [Undibacterium sp. TS12]|uniref:polymorphic toxin type 30 domain-containing protein n=1 Tax=Undibacterium sp. TS12 TaxID=2908202 RepID=UPI001F4D1D45|nr:polymorphic toxin type 30 domain-containing protein [Undibacterium sp. TS12]MCH8622514.1 polymorphic toxin type 30 domain-containing protein [Undibacterium sp. TS12]